MTLAIVRYNDLAVEHACGLRKCHVIRHSMEVAVLNPVLRRSRSAIRNPSKTAGRYRPTAAALDQTSDLTVERDEKKWQRADTKQAPPFAYGAWPDCRLARGSNPAENQQNDYDQEDQPHSSGRVVTPLPAMRPPWQDTQQCQNQDDDQYSSKHIVLLVMYS